jgi:uncharacterized protein HemY
MGSLMRPREQRLCWQEVLHAQERVLGPAHPGTHQSRVKLGSCYLDQERYEEAREVLRKAVQLGTEAFGAEDGNTEWARDGLEWCNKCQEADRQSEACLTHQQQQEVSDPMALYRCKA